MLAGRVGVPVAGRMARIVLITNAWGPKHGGINSFNTDFAKALSLVLAPHTQVTCVVLDATAEEVVDAAKHGVRLLSLGIKGAERVDESRALNVLDAVRQDGTDEVVWWVGHDVISGAAAVALPKLADEGRSALIHHMNYVAYTGYKQGNASAAKKKEEEQRALFKKATEVFAVGPLLRDSLSDLLEGERQVRMLVPGLAEIVPAPLGKTFSGITFGRLDPENDRIKQGRLAIAGFSTACREANAKQREPQALRDGPLLRVIGVLPESEEEKQLRAFAREKAGRVVNLLPLPYEDDRTRLFDGLRRSSFAMMLSWHEGFGLTGWEAIAAEVPLIVSRNSGLCKLVDEKLGDPGLACLTVVEVRGGLGDLGDGDEENFDPADQQDVCEAILDMAHKIERRKQSAKTLRTLLSEQSDGYTWANCARSFADALGLPNHPEGPTPPTAPVPPAAPTVMPTPAPSAGLPSAPVQADFPLLEFKEPSWDPERGQAESQLLRAEEACVPFHESRRMLLDEVLNWARDPAGLRDAIQFRIGSAGAGKTRLMIEVCRELKRQGWEAGFLTNNRGPISELTFKQFLTHHERTFVVVDYAETRQREVVELIRAAFLRGRESTHTVRIMLLAREAGEWWNRLAMDYPTIEPFLTGRAVSGPYRIPEVPLGAHNRETIFREALAAFAKRLNKDHTGILLPDLLDRHFANVLFIHLAAMAALSGERPETASSLLEATLRRERRYWHEAAKAQNLPASFHHGLDQAVAMLTLRGGAKDGSDVRRIVESVPGLHGASTETINKVLEVLRTFYAVSGRIDALRPDMLGERLISQELAKDSSLLEAVLGRKANEATSRSALVVLNRLARQSPSDVIWLERGLQQHLSRPIGIAAIAVAIESGDPIGRVLATVLEKAPEPETYDLIEPLWQKMPQKTIALRECALFLAQRRLMSLEKKTKGKPVGTQKKSKLAEAYLSVASRLSELNEHQKALRMNEKALPLFKELAKLSTMGAANYAICLQNTANRLTDLGKYVQALEKYKEAINLLGDLVRSDSDSFQGDLALALHNLGAVQQQLGDFEGAYRSAEESCKLYRALEPEKFRPDLARSLHGLANALSQLGRNDDAMIHVQQSFAIWTELAEKKPDAFRPPLAEALLSLSEAWSFAGRYKQARDTGEKAVNLYRELAVARPEVFGQDLARAQGSLGTTMLNMGERQRALELASQSLETQKWRMSTDPGADLFQLAIAHLLVSAITAALGRYGEAMQLAEESLELLWRLFSERPEVMREPLVFIHSLKAKLLVVGGKPAEARELLLSCKTIFEELGKGGNARAVLSTRAGFLAVLSQTQLQLQEQPSAIENSRLATEAYEESLREHPLAFREGASFAWRIRAACEAVLGELENAQGSAARGLELLQADLVETPRTLTPWMLETARELVRLAGPLAGETAHAAVYRAIREGSSA